jgi:hypothetical protein
VLEYVDPATSPCPVPSTRHVPTSRIFANGGMVIGRGVFASKSIPARTVLEVSPVLVLDPVENEEHIRKTDLYNYT